jgi:hypothetical protein
MLITRKYKSLWNFDKPEGWGKLNLRRRLRRWLGRQPLETRYEGAEGECPECGANVGRDALAGHRWWVHGVILPASEGGK